MFLSSSSLAIFVAIHNGWKYLKCIEQPKIAAATFLTAYNHSFTFNDNHISKNNK